MAEARIAVATPLVTKSDESTISSWKDAYRIYRLVLIRNYFHLRNSLRNGMWPTSTTHLIVGCGFSIYLLEGKPRYLERASVFLEDASQFLPLPEGTPSWLRHILFSAGTSFTFFIALMKLRQYFLRIFLAYRGWMYENPRKQSFKTLAWGFFVKFAAGYKPSLYSFQNSLPRLPVPPLKDTLDSLIESLEPLSTPEELEKYKKGAKNLQKTIGPRLQRLLQLKSWWAPNYVSDWWEKYAYLMSRLPIAINCNYYVLDHYVWTPTKRQTSRAANVLHSILYMKRQIDRELLRPLVLRSTIPICMMQYERIFSTTRMPGKELDEIVHYDSPESRFVIVSCKGLLYCLTVYDKSNQILSASNLEKLFQEIIDDATIQAETASYAEKSIPALTALPRDKWAVVYNTHFTNGLNAHSMDLIKKAVCMVVFFDKEPVDLSDKGKLLLHGDGKTIWFDKCFTVGVFPDGKCGMNAEHTMADAPVLAHVWEYAMTMEVVEKRYLDQGKVMPSLTSFKQKEFPKPYRMMWHIDNELSTEIENAAIFSKEKCDDLDLIVFNHTAFGKGDIKKVKISPDAFVQIALQLAYFRDSKRFCQTYEASATRLYLHGRTETVRSCTNESCGFVRGMVEGTKSASELVKLLQRAARKHQELYRAAMSGMGVDRHIFALFIVSKGLGYENEFLEEVIRRPWTLSTSQQPQRQIEYDLPDIEMDDFKRMASPGGGFGPVSDEGYGVSYMLPTEYNIFFHVSSKKSCSGTNSQRFVDLIGQSMKDMLDLFKLE